MAVADKVEGEDLKVTALLHDVLEDTRVTHDTLANLFGRRIADAVDALTRREGETYEAFIERVCQDDLAPVDDVIAHDVSERTRAVRCHQEDHCRLQGHPF